MHRTTEADLWSLVERLWAPRHPGAAVRVDLGSPPASHRVVEVYHVVPSVRRPRFLVPESAPAAAAAAFGPHFSSPSRRTAAVGAGIAAAFRAGLASRLYPARLVVSVESSVPREHVARHLVTEAVRDQLGLADLVAIHAVRRQTPNAKPTSRLFRRGGTPVGYAKVGWSPSTVPLTRTEAAALRALAGRVGQLVTPELLVEGPLGLEGREVEVCVASPLPPRLRPWRGSATDTVPHLRAIAATGEVGAFALRGSPYVDDVRARLAEAGAAQPEEAGALRHWLDRLTDADPVLAHGRWHGDWVAWNLGVAREGSAVWDWEYSAACAPVGFDLMHWHFQHALAAPDATVVGATEAMRASVPELGLLGVATEHQHLVASLYVLEMLTRATVLASRGAGWNEKIRPHLVGLASSQDAG